MATHSAYKAACEAALANLRMMLDSCHLKCEHNELREAENVGATRAFREAIGTLEAEMAAVNDTATRR